jgi:hypothetical protein
VEAPRGAEGLPLLLSVARGRAAVARGRAAVARGRAAVARRRAAVARRAARATRCGAAMPRCGGVVTRCGAAATWGRAAVTGRGSAVTGRTSARAGRAAVLGWRAAVTGRVAAAAWQRCRVAGPASGMPGRAVSLATSGSAVIGRGFSERLRLFALLAARALSVQCRLLGRRSSRARTDRVSVALMGRKRIARNGDRHERVLLRVRVVTDRHLLGVLGPCGGTIW